MSLKTVTDIQRIWYGAPMTSVANPATGLSGAEVFALINGASTNEITNVHATTWSYDEAEGSSTDYINQLNGATYHRDYVSGATNVNFSVGQYDYETKADLQGGTATATSWERPKNQGLIYKSLVCQTKDGTYLVFPRAQITARGGMIESKVVGLLLTATPLETGIDGLSSEKWFNASEIA